MVSRRLFLQSFVGAAAGAKPVGLAPLGPQMRQALRTPRSRLLKI